MALIMLLMLALTDATLQHVPNISANTCESNTAKILESIHSLQDVWSGSPEGNGRVTKRFDECVDSLSEMAQWDHQGLHNSMDQILGILNGIIQLVAEAESANESTGVDCDQVFKELKDIVEFEMAAFRSQMQGLGSTLQKITDDLKSTNSAIVSQAQRRPVLANANLDTLVFNLSSFTMFKGGARPPFSKGSCSFNKTDLRDVIEILNATQESRSPSRNVRAALWSKYLNDSAGECGLLINQMLRSVMNVVDLRQNETLKAAEEKQRAVKDTKTQLEKELQLKEIKLRETKERLEQQVRKLERDKDEQVKKELQMVVRLIVMQLNHDDLSTAASEIKKLPSRNDVVEEIVVKALGYNSTKLDNLVAFTTQTGYYESDYLAMNALFVELKRNGKLQENAILTINYYLQFLVQSENYRYQRAILRRNIESLKDQVSQPYADAILKSLVADLLKGEFKRPLEALNATAKRSLENYFMKDIVLRSLTMHGDEVFKKSFSFIAGKLPWMSDACYAFSVIWERLRTNGDRNGLEALQTWLYASFNVEYSQFNNYSSSHWAKCKSIADAAAPAHKAALTREYVDNIQKRNFEPIKTWHRDYAKGMRVLMQDVVESLSLQQMQNENFDNLADAVDNLPFLSDICWAAEAIRKKLVKFGGMLGTYEHFRTLLLVKNAMAHSNFVNVDKFDVAKCRNAMVDTPAVFQKLLYANTSNCRLINRLNSEPLFCSAAGTFSSASGRFIFTWVPKDKRADQFWNIRLAKQGAPYLENNHHTGHFLKFYTNSDGLIGHEKEKALFRVHAAKDDKNYMQLETSHGKRLVGITLGHFPQQRGVQLYKESSDVWTDRKFHWRLDCAN